MDISNRARLSIKVIPTSYGRPVGRQAGERKTTDPKDSRVAERVRTQGGKKKELATRLLI